MTRAEIIARIRRALNDPDGVFLPDAAAQRLVSEAAEFLAEQSTPLWRKTVIPLRAGWTYYRLTASAQDAILPVRIAHRGTGRLLTPTTAGELDAERHRWEATQGDPTHWFPRGWGQFGVYPCPAATSSALIVDYQAWPQTLLHDAAEPEFSLADQEGLYLYGWADGIAKGLQSDQLKPAWDRMMAVIRADATGRTVRLADSAARAGNANGAGG